MTDKSVEIGENKNHDERGRFVRGNKIGRMKKRGYTLLGLTKVAMQYDKTHDESILKHYIEQLMEDNRLLENFINKYVPTKNVSEITSKGEPIKYIIVKSYENCPLKDTGECPVKEKLKQAEDENLL
ncbi:hypothetical protein ES708_34001 [subsurface metagenome]